MVGLITYVLEARKELLVGASLSIIYITYYLLEVVKVPRVVCGDAALRALVARLPAARLAYWPTPWCFEARLQTVLGSILRSRFLVGPAFRREVLPLADGGRVALDWAFEDAPAAAPVLLVLPGLTGSAHADYVRCLAAAARDLGAVLVVFSNRGLGGVPLATPRLYCAVSHDDCAEVVRAVEARRPAARALLAAGVSLGGLILGHYLAAHGAAARVSGALVVSSPLDVIASSESISRPLNAPFSWHCARELVRTVATAGAALGGGWPGSAPGCDWPGAVRSRSVRAFDAAFTARHFGFESVDAYYRAATLRGKLGAVAAPLLCLCAADDPFQPEAALPAAEAAAAPRVALLVTARGGHIGFLEGWWPARPPHTQYIARVASQYFAALLEAPELLHRPSGAPPAPAPAPAVPAPAVPVAIPAQ